MFDLSHQRNMLKEPGGNTGIVLSTSCIWEGRREDKREREREKRE